eukprot:4983-Chlamydomonas_euryale.AAC.1
MDACAAAAATEGGLAAAAERTRAWAQASDVRDASGCARLMHCAREGDAEGAALLLQEDAVAQVKIPQMWRNRAGARCRNAGFRAVPHNHWGVADVHMLVVVSLCPPPARPNSLPSTFLLSCA